MMLLEDLFPVEKEEAHFRVLKENIYYKCKGKEVIVMREIEVIRFNQLMKILPHLKQIRPDIHQVKKNY